MLSSHRAATHPPLHPTLCSPHHLTTFGPPAPVPAWTHSSALDTPALPCLAWGYAALSSCEVSSLQAGNVAPIGHKALTAPWMVLCSGSDTRWHCFALCVHRCFISNFFWMRELQWNAHSCLVFYGQFFSDLDGQAFVVFLYVLSMNLGITWNLVFTPHAEAVPLCSRVQDSLVYRSRLQSPADSCSLFSQMNFEFVIDQWHRHKKGV